MSEGSDTGPSDFGLELKAALRAAAKGRLPKSAGKAPAGDDEAATACAGQQGARAAAGAVPAPPAMTAPAAPPAVLAAPARPAAPTRDFVFISYARADVDVAGELRAYLLGMGVPVWWDGDIPIGANYHRAIGDALDAARAVAVIWSAASVRSGHVFEEAAEALEQNKLVTMRVEGLEIASIPASFRRRQTYPVTEREPLLAALRGLGFPCAPG